MAKYTITFSCGHEDTVELFGKDSERHLKLEHFKEHGKCKKCYAEEMRAQEQAMGLRFNATILPDISNDCEVLVNVWFDGDTLPHKDEIKSIGGYRWCERETLAAMFAQKVIKCWNKTIKLSQLQEETKKAVEIGAKSLVAEESSFTSMSYYIAMDKIKEHKEKQKKIDKIPKPEVPELLKGKQWNGKIYGKKGNYSIYPDGVKTEITDTQADEINTWVDANAEYKKLISKI